MLEAYLTFLVSVFTFPGALVLFWCHLGLIWLGFNRAGHYYAWNYDFVQADRAGKLNPRTGERWLTPKQHRIWILCQVLTIIKTIFITLLLFWSIAHMANVARDWFHKKG